MPKKNEVKASGYNADDIHVLEGLEPVRKRPGMYIGTTGPKGLHHLIWEIVDNAVDEVMNGFADTVEVVLYDDGSVSVKDNGRGIPVDVNKTQNMTGVDLVFTKLHAGGKFDNGGYQFSGGLHGVGASVVNALSEWLEVEVYHDKKVYYERFERVFDADGTVHSGQTVVPLKVNGKTSARGTFVRFKPDKDVFETVEFDARTIRTRVKELAFLNKGAAFIFEDRRAPDPETGEYKRFEYRYKGGLQDFVQSLNADKEKRSDKVIYIEAGASNGLQIQIAIQYTTTFVENIISYVNNIPTTEGGTHETGFKLAFTKAMNEYIKRNKLMKDKDKDLQLVGEDYREGMTAVINLKLKEVQFEGQTKTKLGNPEVKGIVDSIVYEKLTAYFSEPKNKDIALLIAKLAINAGKIRQEEKKIKDALRSSKNSMTGKTAIGKLSNCSGRDYSRNELFIVEGDSAGGSAKKGRDRTFQAVLALRGKPLNTEKSKKTDMLQNAEINTIIYALGTDFDKDFNIKNLKFDKIIILADADHDGEHIRCLLLTFFYRYMRPLVTEGHVYLGMPPLYRVTQKGVTRYAYNDLELDKILHETKGQYNLQRYKGLGEMNDDQLWETTLNPKTRTLTRVTVEDAAEADEMISLLMGNNADRRKEFINENANFNKVDAFQSKLGGQK